MAGNSAVMARNRYTCYMPAFSGIDCKNCGLPRERIEYKGRARWICKPCANKAARGSRTAYYLENREKILARNRAWFEANPERARATSKAYQENRVMSGAHRGSYLRKKYGISLEQYEGLFQAQGGVCAICHQPETRKVGVRALTPDGVHALSVDHCHETGKIRGLLCTACNVLIGFAKEDVAVLRRSIEYLESSRAE